MLSFLNKETTNFDVIVGPESKITGDIESEGSVRLDGVLIGSVKCKGEVIVTEKAQVEGNIICESANIFGKCIGNIETSGTVDLHTNSIMRGDVKAESLKTETGCEFTGNCEINPGKHSITTSTPSRNDTKEQLRSNHSNSNSKKEPDKKDQNKNSSKPDATNKSDSSKDDNKNKSNDKSNDKSNNK